MLYRSIIEELNKWAASTNRKPLILRGARQVGKTTAINQFSPNFDQYIYLNLEIEEEADFFENTKTIHEIVKTLFFVKNITETSGKILIFIDDISKYARNERMRNILKHCIETAPIEAGKRIKFHGFGGSSYISKDISEALKTLERAMLLYLIYPSLSIEIPASPQINKSPKLQLFDTGLLNYFADLQKHFFKYDNLHAFYRGVLAEHIVMQEIIGYDMSTAHKPNFWIREKKQSNAEIDLIIPYEDYLIPIEIKAGKTGTLRSLHQFINRAPHHFAIRFYSAELKLQKIKTPDGKEFILLNLPYFLVSKISDYIEWMIKKQSLLFIGQQL